MSKSKGHLAKWDQYPHWCVVTEEYDDNYIIEYKMTFHHEKVVDKNEIKFVTKNGEKIEVRRKWLSRNWKLPKSMQ